MQCGKASLEEVVWVIDGRVIDGREALKDDGPRIGGKAELVWHKRSVKW